MARSRAKRVRLKEIAQASGSSIATVSMALSDHPDTNAQTKRKIWAISQQLGYRRPHPKTAGSKRTSEAEQVRRFGFLLLGTSLEDEANLGSLHALAEQTAKVGVRLEVQAITDQPQSEQALQRALAFGAALDGLILCGPVGKSLLTALEATAKPYVIFGHSIGDEEPMPPHCQCITSDEAAMGEYAARYLIACGHRRIGFICERLVEGMWNARWLQGYKRVRADGRMENDAQLIQCSGVDFSGAEAAAQALLSLPDPPTAYIVPDARVAASFLSTLRVRRVGVAPQAIVISGQASLLERYGLDGYPWVGYDPALLAAVTVRQLQQSIVEAVPCAMEIAVPFLHRNMPAAPSHGHAIA